MAVIAFVNQKGGVGKSTTCIHFCCWLRTQKKKSVCLVDADPQRSSSKWLKRLDIRMPVSLINDADQLIEKIPLLAGKVDYLIVDGPAGLADSIRSILLRSDVAVCPVQPTGLDLISAAEAVKQIQQIQSARGGSPKGAVFLSRAFKRTKLLNEAQALLERIEGVKVLQSIIYQRQLVSDCFSQNTTVWEMGKAEESRQEYEALFREIMKLL